MGGSLWVLFLVGRVPVFFPGISSSFFFFFGGGGLFGGPTNQAKNIFFVGWGPSASLGFW